MFAENFMRCIDGLPLDDGPLMAMRTASSKSGLGKVLLIDFNYDVEPLPGKFPIPGIGPFSLLQDAHEPLGQDALPLDVLESSAQG